MDAEKATGARNRSRQQFSKSDLGVGSLVLFVVHEVGSTFGPGEVIREVLGALGHPFGDCGRLPHFVFQ